MAEKPDLLFRGTKNGLHLVLNGTKDFNVLKAKLKEHLNRADNFFQGADVTLDIGDAEFSLDQILELQQILATPHGLHLKKIVSGRDESKREGRRHRESGDATDRSVLGGTETEYRVRNQVTEGAFVYKGTLRSGQRISHDGDVVVVGDVNPGAEVTAGGDIIVMGSLRGLAHAGTAGAKEAVVVAFNLKPTQIRIGSAIGRPPEGDVGSREGPEVARLKDGVIVIEPLDESRWEGDW